MGGDSDPSSSIIEALSDTGWRFPFICGGSSEAVGRSGGGCGTEHKGG